MSNTKDPGLGLPGDTAPTKTAPTREPFRSADERPFVKYTLPEKVLGLDWGGSGFLDSDRTFRLAEVTPIQQDHAAKISSGNQSALGRELLFAAIIQVGEWKTGRNRDKLTSWWKAIGAKSRRMVEAAFMKMQSVEESDIETFLDSGSPGIG